jgi:N-acetylglucosaminyldiphosphoundecaprenol N-acetyl-beta-D-mannosaminyltransferase
MSTLKSLPTPNGTIDRGASDVTPSHTSDQEGYRSFPERARVKFPTFNLVGIRVQAITAHDLLAIISEAVLNQAKYVVANHNMHSLYVWHHNSKMRDLHAQADFTHVDGVALIALFRLFGGRLKREHRTTYLDLWPLLGREAVKQGWRIYYLGSKTGVAEKGAARLREQYHGLQLRTHHGFFDTRGAENEAVLADIRVYAPDVLMVGMGMPRQEAWINENLNHIAARTIFCSGCTMEYIAGKIPTCPRWLAGIGFEWLYRLLSEPARLWRRYLVEPWFILGQLGSAYFKLGRSFGASSSILEDGNE